MLRVGPSFEKNTDARVRPVYFDSSGTIATVRVPSRKFTGRALPAICMPTAASHTCQIFPQIQTGAQFLDGSLPYRLLFMQPGLERYRNRLQVERELSFDGHRITPFAAVEAFYDTRFSAWNRKRLYVGVRIPLSRHVSLEPYFMRQRDSEKERGF